MVGNLENTVITLCMIGSRASGLVVFAPLFGHAAVSARIKAAIVVALVALIFPVISGRILHNGESLPALAVISEMVIGLTMGFAVNLVFDGLQLAGHIVGTQFGFSLVNIIDPQTQVDTPVLAVFHQVIGILIFLQLGVHHWILRGFARSFEYLPVGAAVNSYSALELWKSFEAVWFIGIQIAGPVLAATLLTDIGLGFLSKASVHFPALLFGISAKYFIGLAVLFTAIRYWPALLERHFADAITLGERVLHCAK